MTPFARLFLTTLWLAAVALRAQPSPFSWPAMPLSDGGKLEFRIHFPEGVTPESPRPIALVFVDGAQDREQVWNTLAHRFWMQVPREGIGVILPVAPAAGRFHEGGLEALATLLRNLRGRTRMAGNGLHAVGLGEGAASAIAAVRRWPHEFASLTIVATGGAEAEPPALPDGPAWSHVRVKVLAGGDDETEAMWKALRAAAAPDDLPADAAPIHECLDRFHSAAARCDAATYWSLWHEDGVFLPPGDMARWPVAELRERCADPFAKAPGWVLVPSARHVRLAADGATAWVDEALGGADGARRGTALLVRDGDAWKVLRYALSGAADTLPGAPF